MDELNNNTQQTGVADSGSKDYQTPQSEIVTHMRGTLERVMMYLTNVNSCDPVELGVRVAQSLRLGGADKHMLDEAVEALTKGFAPAAMEPDIDLANDYRQLKENAEELAAMVETLADQGQQLQFTVDKLAGLLFRQHETQLRLDVPYCDATDETLSEAYADSDLYEKTTEALARLQPQS